MDADDTTPLPSSPRETMIATAVNFLQNPKVRESNFSQRRAFLEKKGLTKEEIDIAIQRSGTGADEFKQPPSGPPAAVQGVTQGVIPPQPVSFWVKARDYLATAIVVGGLSYAIYMFYKKYIYPIWFGPSEEEKQLLAIKNSVQELQNNIAETLSNIIELQQLVNKQQQNIDDVVKTNAAQRGSTEMARIQESQQSTEIKEEIKSLKGLLLNRKQFPAAPKTAPIIPAWQLESQRAEQASIAMQPSPDKEEVSQSNKSTESADVSVQIVDAANKTAEAEEDPRLLHDEAALSDATQVPVVCEEVEGVPQTLNSDS